MGNKVFLSSLPPPYTATATATTAYTKLVNVDEKPCTDKIKYAIFYRYLTGLRRTFSGPAIFETYEECKAYCDDLNALNAQKHYEDGVLFHFPG